MLNIGIFDTILYTFATIGLSVVIKSFYQYIDSSLYLDYQRLNIKYDLARVYSWFSSRIGRKKVGVPQPSRMVRTRELSENERLKKETEVMDILSKTTTYYDSLKKLLESMIKDIPNPEQQKKIDQWYQDITKLIETPLENTDKSNLEIFLKRISECSNQLFELIEEYR